MRIQPSCFGLPQSRPCDKGSCARPPQLPLWGGGRNRGQERVCWCSYHVDTGALSCGGDLAAVWDREPGYRSTTSPSATRGGLQPGGGAHPPHSRRFPLTICNGHATLECPSGRFPGVGTKQACPGRMNDKNGVGTLTASAAVAALPLPPNLSVAP